MSNCSGKYDFLREGMPIEEESLRNALVPPHVDYKLVVVPGLSEDYDDIESDLNKLQVSNRFG